MPGSQDLNEASAESNDPRHQVLVQSASNLGQGITVDTVVRWVDALPDPYVPSHFGLDLRVAWATPWGLEIAATGRNLLEADHMEFVPASPSPRRIGRSGQLTLAFRRGQIDGRP